MKKTTKLYILILVWSTLTFIQGHSCQKLQCSFSHKFLSINVDEVHCVATTCWFAEALARLVLHKYS